MNSDLESFRLQLLAIRQDAPSLWGGLSDIEFNWKPSFDKWSIAECLAHLSPTASRTVPVLDEMIARGRAKGLLSDGPFVLGLIERAFIRSLEPPVRFRARAPRRLLPPSSSGLSIAAVRREFMEWQDAIDARLDRADGIDLVRVKGPSPAFPLIRWSLGAMLAVTLAHERRHIWQARELRKHPQFPAVSR